MIKELTINGLRGFGEPRSIQFAMPDGRCGSGLTIFVGANNSGKTTIFEALRSFNSQMGNPPSFSERKRNVKCENGKIHLSVQTDTGTYRIDTVEEGGSTTTFKKEGTVEGEWWDGINIFVLQSRRFSDYEFHRSDMGRDDYIRNQQMNTYNRSSTIYEFNARLFKMQKNKSLFDKLLQQVLGYDLNWTIEQNDNGMYYLKLSINGCAHSSEGLGDGIWSVFTICDALYDSTPGSVIAIDEPELSLHPAYQKRILQLFDEFSKDRQIFINTHSPYFLNFEALVHGAFLYRTVKNSEGNIDVFALSDESKKYISSFLKDINQPHTLGLEAKEMFFMEDRVILTEGQEDVVMYQKASENVDMRLGGTFFGWGSGGASNISKIAYILHDLGYKKVAAIFDGDKPDELNQFKRQFPEYSGVGISAADVRDKKAVNNPEKKGMMTQSGKLKDEFKDEISQLFSTLNMYFSEQT